MKPLQRLNDLIAALGTRERVLVVIALLGGLYFAVNTLFLADLSARRATAETERTAIEARLVALRLQASNAERDSTGQARLADKQRELATLKTRLELVTVVERALSETPLSVPMLIEQALRTPNSRVVVDSVRIRDSETLFESIWSPIYRHGIDLQVRGSYADLVRYLEVLERDDRILWSGLKLSATQYPELTLTISLYTLSRSAKPTLS